MKKNTVIPALYIGLLSSLAIGGVTVTDIEPTEFFPVQEDQVSRQLYRVHIDNDSDEEADVQLQCVIEGKTVTGDCKAAANSRTVVELAVPEITRPTKATVTIVDPAGTILDSRTTDVGPQKKWRLYFTSVSHQDLGFANYYQYIRRDVRERGIDNALEYCSLSDDWPEDSKFRWTVETSEPVIRWANTRSPQKVAELVRRVKEGRISLGGLHNSISTEMAGYEVFARSFYTPNRYVVDMLGVDPAKVAIINDVPGLTRTLPLYLKEAQIPYFMQGTNAPHGLADTINEPVFYWTSPDNDENAVICRTDSYYSPNDIKEWTRKEVKRIVDRHVQIDWKYDCILAYDSEDFSVPHFENAENIRKWNEKWAYPKVICSTIEMFFDSINSQINPDDIKRFDKGAPDAWADQDSTDAALLAKAREVTEKLPTAEKFSSFAMALNGGYPEKDIWQAYNRMVMYHEHTNSAIHGGNPAYYETEKIMHGTLVGEAEDYTDAAFNRSIGSISNLIKTKGDTLVVYNPLNWQRTDTVFVDDVEDDVVLTDNATGDRVGCQKLANGKSVFVAKNVPSLGYKTFAVSKGRSSMSRSELSEDTVCENDYYRITIDRKKNIISSIIDKSANKEMLDSDSPYHLGEYLYNDHTGNKKLNRSVFQKITCYKGNGVDEIHITQDTPDTRNVKLIVYLYKDIGRMDFDMRLYKRSNGHILEPAYHSLPKEGALCAIPLKVPDYEFNYELSGAVAQPATNQFEGSETAFFAIQHFSDVSNSQYGMTLSTKECPILIYGHPRVANWDWNADHESIMKKPVSSNMFLYLMNNMFFTNIRTDQPGEKRFRWSLQGHKGDWREGRAYNIGWDSSNPLFAARTGENLKGSLCDKSHSFVSVDVDNVVCSTVKPAESNGKGYILRFYELSGSDTTVNVTASFMDRIESAVSTSLIENDLSPVKVTSDNSFSFDIKGSGLKTIRITAKPDAESVEGLTAKAESDMRIDLAWSAPKNDRTSHFAIYRGLDAGFKAGSLSFVGTSKESTFTDRPELNVGGWPHNILQPDTEYFYKVCVVDKNNNKGELSGAVACKTLKTSQANQKPSKVKGLYAVHVSPNGPDNYINVWFYTNCEPDVSVYEVYRGTDADFKPEIANRVGIINSDNDKGLNRQMFADKTVNANIVYYYKVCAMDELGRKGDFSEPCGIEMYEPQLVISSDASGDIDDLSTKQNIEIKWRNGEDEIYYTLDGSKPSKNSFRYKSPFLIENSVTVTAGVYPKDSDDCTCIVTAHFVVEPAFSQSDYGSGYEAHKAIDGVISPDSTWISSPYGGQARENANDIWFAVPLPANRDLKGLYLVGDDRDVVSTMDRFKVYLRINNEWQFVSDAKYDKALPKNHFKIHFDKVMNADAVRLVFPKDNLPVSADKGQDGIVRIYELKFVTPDGNVVTLKEL